MRWTSFYSDQGHVVLIHLRFLVFFPFVPLFQLSFIFLFSAHSVLYDSAQKCTYKMHLHD